MEIEKQITSGLGPDNHLPDSEKLVGRRIENQNDYGTVKYHGKLLHHDEKQDPNQIWVGVQWDKASRGRHNGVVQGAKYFDCDDGKTSGSLLKVDKANFGVTIYTGIHQRYFMNVDHTPTTDAEGQLNAKGVVVEYDEDAYFETVRKFKKKVEFLGFDKIWKKINDLQHLKELSLPGCNISDIGPDGSLKQLVPNLLILSLEDNLLYDWNQVYLIGRELKKLESLQLSGNIMALPEEDVTKLDKIIINSNDTVIHEAPANVFGALKTVVLLNMRLTWKDLNKVIPLFLNVEEMFLCDNHLRDFENFTYTGADFKNLKALNVERNGLESFEGMMKFSNAPKLERLIISHNKLKDLGKVSGFEALKSVIIEENDISQFYILAQLNTFPNLESLRITKNPIYAKHSMLHVRQRAIAEIKGLKIINGSELKKYERKDCEIYYLRSTFQEYFDKTGQTSNGYDYKQLLDYCASEHPRIPELIKLFGNPYEEGLHGNKLEKDPSVAALKGNKAGFVVVKLLAFTGAAVGKPPAVKKFTANTLITNLKAMLAKQFTIAASKQKVYYRTTPEEPYTPLNEDLKDLNFYGVKDGGEIWVGDRDI